MQATMQPGGSWIEWMACGISAVAAVMALRFGGSWILTGVLALIAGWVAGSAKALLLPAVLGGVLFWICWKAGGHWKWAGLAVALGGVMASMVLCWLFPLPEPPAMSGPHAVGTLTFELVAEGAAPALVVQAWYPAGKDGTAPRSPWLADPELAPRFPYHRIGKALSRSLAGADLSDSAARYPVVFYEHAWNGHREENVAQVEDLASRGFVVIAVDHPGQAERVRYHDGSVVVTRLPNPIPLASEGEVADFESLAEKCIDERVRALSRVRQALARGFPDQLSGRLAWDRLGVFGFSFGGTCAIRLCAEDPSFHAGANEDGLFLGNGMPRGPFLFFDEEMPGWLLKDAEPRESPENAMIRRSETRILRAMNQPDRFRVILDGTVHMSFTDRIFTSRNPRLARVGTQPAEKVHSIITRQLGDFFERELPPVE